jgi:hypothetical protein
MLTEDIAEELPDDAETRSAIKRRMFETGVIQSLNDKLRFGMIVAIQALRSNSSEKSIEYMPFADVHESELLALQSIYRYLSLNGLHRTFLCLQTESRVNALNGSYFDLIDCISTFQVSDSRKGSDISPFQRIMRPIDPSIEITKEIFNSLPLIISVDDL